MELIRLINHANDAEKILGEEKSKNGKTVNGMSESMVARKHGRADQKQIMKQALIGSNEIILLITISRR